MSTLRKKIDFLLSMQNEAESNILAKAIEVGITKLYDGAVTEAYLEGKIERSSAIAELGVEKVSELDSALESEKRDVAWGLRDD